MVCKKTCVCCGEEYPNTDEYFHHKKGYADGLDTHCKNCRNLKHYKYRNEHKDQYRKMERLRRQKLKRQHPKLYKELNRLNAASYRQNNRESYREYQREYQQKKWLKDPINKLSHAHRVRMASKIKSFLLGRTIREEYHTAVKKYQPQIKNYWNDLLEWIVSEGYSFGQTEVHHIIPLHIFYRFNQDLRDDIVSHFSNLQVMDKIEHKHKWNQVDEESLQVAELLEKLYSSELNGFKYFVATFSESTL